ncbi:hypothetical protein [Streptomonospora nanhaiensis]|nr:hypothetical protein [Streptomonospora nanhaiensis]
MAKQDNRTPDEIIRDAENGGKTPEQLREEIKEETAELRGDIRRG